MAKKNDSTQPMSEAFAELEGIVSEFEDGELDLEESLPKFRKGLELTKYLKKRLKTLENEITEIQEEFSDDLEKKSDSLDTSSHIAEAVGQDDLPF